MAVEQFALFEEGVGRIEPEAASLTLVSRRGRPLTKAQQTFNRLVTKIESLRLKLERATRRLDDALAYYGEHLYPRLRRKTELRKGLVRALAAFIDDKRQKGKNAHFTLGQLLAAQLEEIQFEEGSLADDDLRALFERLHGRGFEEVAREQFEETREEIESMLSDFGINIDLSDIKPGMSEETLAAKAAETMARLRREVEEKQQSSSLPRRKNRRQMEREERQRQAEELRKKTAATIYKQLARVLHPDLELDAALRRQKEVLMQELTAAYRNNDMLTLLRLEMEWIERQEGDIERLTDEKLAIYNQTLNEQVQNLERELCELPYHPRYQPITVPDGPFGVRIQDGPAQAHALDEANASMEASTRDLQSSNGFAKLKAILQSYREEQRAMERELRRFRF